MTGAGSVFVCLFFTPMGNSYFISYLFYFTILCIWCNAICLHGLSKNKKTHTIFHILYTGVKAKK